MYPLSVPKPDYWSVIIINMESRSRTEELNTAGLRENAEIYKISWFIKRKYPPCIVLLVNKQSRRISNFATWV